ncbi:hypothetical protein GQ54DRAFT_23611 [Martensiomyces pterosporus]|nr:hypothetical protein GQ54DRAFT_23611 [Martensiomyces pterosporus]
MPKLRVSRPRWTRCLCFWLLAVLGRPGVCVHARKRNLHVRLRLLLFYYPLLLAGWSRQGFAIIGDGEQRACSLVLFFCSSAQRYGRIHVLAGAADSERTARRCALLSGRRGIIRCHLPAVLVCSISGLSRPAKPRFPAQAIAQKAPRTLIVNPWPRARLHSSSAASKKRALPPLARQLWHTAIDGPARFGPSI